MWVYFSGHDVYISVWADHRSVFYHFECLLRSTFSAQSVIICFWIAQNLLFPAFHSLAVNSEPTVAALRRPDSGPV